MNSSEIKKIISNKCPLLRTKFFNKPQNIWLTDKEYFIPTSKSLLEDILKYSTSNIPYIKSKVECEEFALFLTSNIRKGHWEDQELKNNWAFGIASGYSPNGIHNMNICLTSNGLKLIEPQNNKIIDFDTNTLNPFFIWM